MDMSSRIACVLGGICLISSIFAENREGSFSSPTPSFGKSQLSDVAKRVDAADKKANEVSEMKVSKTLGIKNPFPMGCCGGQKGIFNELTFLYWKGISEGLYYAKQTTNNVDELESKMRTVKFHARPGVRYALGYTSGYDGWNVQGIYTWTRFTGERSGNAGPLNLNNLVGFLVNQTMQDPSYNVNLNVFQIANAHWRLNYNIGDIQFGRGFLITKALAVQPFLGVRAGCLYQKFKAAYEGNFFTLLSDEFSWAYKLVFHSNYWGVGPRIGVDTKWTLPYNFGFTGLISGSLLYGKAESNLRWFASPSERLAAPTDEVGREIRSRCTIVPTVQLALGLDWGMKFDKDRMYWGLNLGWEFNYWWKPLYDLTIFQFPQPFEIQGLTLRTDLHF